MTDRPTPSATDDHGTPPTLLIADDDAIFRERLARSFRTRGYDVRTAGNVKAALEAAREDSPELAVVDLRMPGGTGVELLRELKTIDPSTKVLILTGYGSMATAVEAVKLGAENVIPKPADADEILAAFERGEKPNEAVQTDYQAPTLARIEWEHIQRVLTDCGGNISEAARRLGIHRRSLQRKLNKYAPRS
ncbi:MAG: response regulator transcription factor [Planctomycetota bacterium JB042]